MGEAIRYEARDRRAVQDWLRFPVVRRLARGRRGLRRAGSRAPGASRARGSAPSASGSAPRAAPTTASSPHGYHLEPDDANIDQTYGKEPLAFGPDEVGSHPASRSPFGLDDMCGNVFEWTMSSLAPSEHVLRGGGFYYDATTARIANRQVAEPDIHDANVGLRVCVTFDATERPSRARHCARARRRRPPSVSASRSRAQR